MTTTPVIPVTITVPEILFLRTIQNGTVTEGAILSNAFAVWSNATSGMVTINVLSADFTTNPTSPIVIAPPGLTTPFLGSLTSINDFIAQGDRTVTVTLNVSSATITGPSVSFNVQIIDDDTVGVIIIETGGNTRVKERGETDTFSVILNSQPTANVTINLNTGTQLTSNISQVIFTPQNWNIAQEVTVIAINDTVDEGNHTGIIQFTSSSSDGNYHNLAIAPLTVNITDIKELTPGNDTFYGTSGHEIIDALAGSDRIFGQDGDDIIYGNTGADILYGGAGIDTLYGGEDSDRLYGDAGNDKIYGGAGADILYGGAGIDYLDGGTGSDRYYGEAGADTFVIGSGKGLDTIYDYQKNLDKIFVLGSIRTFEEKSGSNVLIKSGTETLATVFNVVVGQISYVSSVP